VNLCAEIEHLKGTVTEKFLEAQELRAENMALKDEKKKIIEEKNNKNNELLKTNEKLRQEL
jgi:cell shape-determining protein MreC